MNDIGQFDNIINQRVDAFAMPPPQPPPPPPNFRFQPVTARSLSLNSIHSLSGIQNVPGIQPVPGVQNVPGVVHPFAMPPTPFPPMNTQQDWSRIPFSQMAPIQRGFSTANIKPLASRSMSITTPPHQSMSFSSPKAHRPKSHSTSSDSQHRVTFTASLPKSILKEKKSDASIEKKKI